MTSRRRFALPAIARTLRGAGAVLAVAAFVAALVLTGRPTGVHVAAARVSSEAAALATVHTVRQPDVTRALTLFGFSTPKPAAPAVARATRAQNRAPLHSWVRPNWGPLTSPFGYRWGRLHAGIDLAGPYGSTIVAATDGCITYAGPQDGYGEVMRISDWDGTETVYGHMSAFLRHSGCVKAGTPIASVGAAGDATGPHLHFEVHVGGTPIDPIPFLAKRGVFI